MMLLAGCGTKKDQTTPAGGAPPVQRFPVFTVKQQTTTLNQDYPANLQGQQNIEIRPRVDGYIDKILVDEGSTVKKGQVLFRISAPQFVQDVNTSLAAVKSAEVEVSNAQMQVDKTRPLVEKDIISKFELESAENSLQIRKEALAQAKANLANSRTNLGYSNVISPVNGVVGTIPYRLGSLVSGSNVQPLTTVSNIDKIYAYFGLNEKQLLAFSRDTEGKTLEAKLKNLPPVSLILADGSTYPDPGRIETVSGLLNSQTGTASFRATFPNPVGLLRSGASATIRIPKKVENAILVPQKATYELQGKYFLYVMDGNGVVNSREIRIMDLSAGHFYVVTEGLKEGETVVLDGASNLKDGMTISGDTKTGASAYQELE
jgi:membrane fusion protein (multidrug efflux system)